MALKTATPYMLRNDGKLLECGDIHQYMIYYLDHPLIEELGTLLEDRWDFFVWFYNNTNSETTRKNLRQLIIEEYFSHFVVKEFNQDISFLGDISEKDCWHLTEAEFWDLYQLCNNETNQEFCRVRTSNMRFGGTSGDIYFRISSVGFNWFNLIWQLVYDNQSFITHVTICTDSQSKGGRTEFYKHGATSINRLPVKDFITLSGNPIIESSESFVEKFLASGLSLYESLDMHPRRVNEAVNMMWRKQLKDKFGAKEK